MRIILSTLARLAGNRRAATAVEYGLILALIVLAIMLSLVSLGQTTQTMWNNVADRVDKATN